MLSIHSPLQVMLIAAAEYVPEDLHIRIVYCEGDVNGEKVEVTEEDERTRLVVLASDQYLGDMVESLLVGIALAATGDEGRGIRYCHMRDNIRAAYDLLRQPADP